MWTAGLEGPGKAKLFGDGSVELQNLISGEEETAKKLAEILSESGLNAKYSNNIHYSIFLLVFFAKRYTGMFRIVLTQTKKELTT